MSEPMEQEKASEPERAWNCAACGHGWGWHADYDDSLERFVTHACEHYNACACRAWSERVRPSESGSSK